MVGRQGPDLHQARRRRVSAGGPGPAVVQAGTKATLGTLCDVAVTGAFKPGSFGRAQNDRFKESSMKKTILTLAVGLSLAAVAGAQAQQLQSPVGVWEIEMRDSRYQVEMCGEGNQQLCGTLIWLGNGADTPENVAYLNTLMIDHAAPAGANRWTGALHLYGQTAGGTITHTADDTMTLEGCMLMVVCKSYQLYRVE
jgi:uncharacterized protein (DUF2147 family)